MGKRILTGAMVCAFLGIAGPAAHAGIVVYKDGDKEVEIGGQIQIQYLQIDPQGGEAIDQTFFRRLRPYIQGTLSENWAGKIEFDFGKSLDADEVAVKDAYFSYTGFKNEKSALYIGNTKSVFAREFLTSSKRLHFVERGFTGDHNFGTPDRMLGVRFDSMTANRKLGYKLSFGAEHIDPNAAVLDFDSPVNNASDWNEGPMLAGRIDFMPLGEFKFEEADFHSDHWRVLVGLGAFAWDNDGDTTTYTDGGGNAISDEKVDVDKAQGYELTAGLRGHGLSADVHYQMISADTVDPTFTGVPFVEKLTGLELMGLYRDGTTDLNKLQVKAGYMIVKNNVEIVASWDSFDADNYEDAWTLTSIGANYYWNKHNGKVQLQYVFSDHYGGLTDNELDRFQVQTQFVF